jgi:predicted nucleic acid-binding Zn ribbon protein
MVFMGEPMKKCMVCGKPAEMLKGGICEPCQERIRREAMGEQSGMAEQAERELSRHGIVPRRK